MGVKSIDYQKSFRIKETNSYRIHKLNVLSFPYAVEIETVNVRETRFLT